MSNPSLNCPTSHGRHISKSYSRLHPSVGCSSDGRSMRYASWFDRSSGGNGWPNGALPTQHFQSTNENPASLYPGYTSGLQHPCQIDDWHNYVAPDISQPADPFSIPALDNSLTGQGYERLQLELNNDENGSQYTYQHGNLNNDALFGMNQPQYHFPNTALDTGSMIPLYDDLELNLWEMSPLGTTPSNALGMYPDPFSNTSGMLHTNGAQLEPAIRSTIVPVPDAVAPSVNDDSNRCMVCNRTFSRPQDLRRHMGKHRSPKYKCFYFDCDKTFYRNDKFRDHLRQGHKGYNPFQRFSD